MRLRRRLPSGEVLRGPSSDRRPNRRLVAGAAADLRRHTGRYRIGRRRGRGEHGEQHSGGGQDATGDECDAGQRGAGECLARWPGDINADRDHVDQPADHLDQRGVVLHAERPGEQRSLNRAGPNHCAQVQRGLLAEVEPPGFVRGTQRVHDQAAGDQHEDQAGGPEEPRQIQPHPAAVDAVPEGDCHHDAQERAEPSQRPARALVERREQEHHGLEALTHDGQERHCHQGKTRADRERRRRRALQLTLQIARVPFHPNDHVGHHQNCNGADDALQTLLLTLRQVLRDHPKQDAHSRAQQHTRAHADEHPTQYVAAALLDQERGDDADDERRLEAFPQADHEGREHDRSVLLGKAYLRDRSSWVWDRSAAPGVRFGADDLRSARIRGDSGSFAAAGALRSLPAAPSR